MFPLNNISDLLIINLNNALGLFYAPHQFKWPRVNSSCISLKNSIPHIFIHSYRLCFEQSKINFSEETFMFLFSLVFFGAQIPFRIGKTNNGGLDTFHFYAAHTCYMYGSVLMQHNVHHIQWTTNPISLVICLIHIVCLRSRKYILIWKML